MVRLVVSAAVATIACIPIGMLQMHSSFTESLGVGLAIGLLVLVSPFIGGGR